MKAILLALIWVTMMTPAKTAPSGSIFDFVHYVDSLFVNNSLHMREFPNTSFALNVKGYYLNDELILVQTLSPGNFGGTETKYYVKDFSLLLVVESGYPEIICRDMDDYCNSHTDKYGNCDYSKIKSSRKVTTVTYGEKPDLKIEQYGQNISISKKEKLKRIREYLHTYNVLIKELS